MAGDPLVALMLLGMGYDEVSVAPQFVPEVKFAVRNTTLERATALADEVRKQRSANDVRAVLDEARANLYRNH